MDNDRITGFDSLRDAIKNEPEHFGLIFGGRGSRVSTFEHLNMLYQALRIMKDQRRENFDPGEYKWVLGTSVVSELTNTVISRYQTAMSFDKPRALFGIEVETDYKNKDTIALYENITNKISVRVEPTED